MFTIEDHGGGVFRLGGRLDASQVASAEATLQGAAGAVTLDLAGLEYIASAGISVVLALYKRLHASGGSLKMTHPTPHVYNVFKYAGLDQVLNIQADA